MPDSTLGGKDTVSILFSIHGEKDLVTSISHVTGRVATRPSPPG